MVEQRVTVAEFRENNLSFLFALWHTSRGDALGRRVPQNERPRHLGGPFLPRGGPRYASEWGVAAAINGCTGDEG